MALTDRKLVRQEISALFNGITEVQENLAYPPLALEGKSPVVWMYGDGTLPQMLARLSNQFDYFFIITIAINRQAHGSASEDLLDTIWTKVLQAIRDNVSGTNYSALEAATQRSRPIFAKVDGIPYRFEEIPLMARSNISG
jgi:hypothetical protein